MLYGLISIYKLVIQFTGTYVSGTYVLANKYIVPV